MPKSTFHNLRLRALDHGKAMTEFATELEIEELTITEKLLSYAAPSYVGVIGNRDSGKTNLIANLIDVPVDDFAVLGAHSEYRFLHHVKTPPAQYYTPESSAFVPREGDLLKKLTFVEVRHIDHPGVLPKDAFLERCEGLIFIIDATDPWSGTVWKQFENYCESHQGRLTVCVTKADQLHKKDWPVLHKHLKDKLRQFSDKPFDIKVLDQDDLFIFQELRLFLENNAVGPTRWAELRSLRREFERSYDEIETAITHKKNQLTFSSDIAHSLHHELEELKGIIHSELVNKIDTVGSPLAGKAKVILYEVRHSLSNKNYFRSLVGKNTSLDAFHAALEEILSKAIYDEVEDHYHKAEELIVTHSLAMSERYAELKEYCPQFDQQDTGKKLNSELRVEEVNGEILQVLRQLRFKALFREELQSIDYVANLRLRLASVALIIAGVLGSFGFHLFGGVFAILAVISFFWCLGKRTKGIDDFFNFLEEWFLGVGPRMQEPIGVLTGELVQKSVEAYRACFEPYLDSVNARQGLIPDKVEKSKMLFLKNEELISELRS